jgi:hypothetical protein
MADRRKSVKEVSHQPGGYEQRHDEAKQLQRGRELQDPPLQLCQIDFHFVDGVRQFCHGGVNSTDGRLEPNQDVFHTRESGFRPINMGTAAAGCNIGWTQDVIVSQAQF